MERFVINMVNNSLIKNEDKKIAFSSFLTQEAIKNRIREVVGGGSEGQAFMTSILSAVTNNTDLQECEQISILNCAFLGQALKLSPSPQLGQYYMVPFKDNNKGIKVAQFQLGYKGYIQLAIRSGQYKKLNVLAVKEGELIKYDPLNEDIEINLIEDDETRENTATVGYYAMFEYVNGFRKTLYWSKKKMEAHAKKYSNGYRADLAKHTKYTFWSKDFDGMAYKTMIIQLISKWGIMSVDMQKAFENDFGYVDNTTGKIEYPDNTAIPSEIVEIPVLNNQPGLTEMGQKTINEKETINLSAGEVISENNTNSNDVEDFLNQLK